MPKLFHIIIHSNVTVPYLFTAKLHRIRSQCKAGPAVHPEEPGPVQAVGVRDVAGVRVHNLRDDLDQHVVACHEVLSAAGTVHAVP